MALAFRSCLKARFGVTERQTHTCEALQGPGSEAGQDCLLLSYYTFPEIYGVKRKACYSTGYVVSIIIFGSVIDNSIVLKFLSLDILH